jgi:hypothetical protein
MPERLCGTSTAALPLQNEVTRIAALTVKPTATREETRRAASALNLLAI